MFRHIIWSRAQQFRGNFAVTASLLMAVALCGWFAHSSALAQPYAGREISKRPTALGNLLLHEMKDFRGDFYEENILNEKVRRGVVCFSENKQLEGAEFKEYPVAAYQTVEDALRPTSRLYRKGRRPQIRVVQKDAIIQSSIDDASLSNGLSAEFLHRKLNAGDIIFVLPRLD